MPNRAFAHCRARLSTWLAAEGNAALVCTLSFVLVVRLLSLRMISNPDASVKWGFVRDVLHGAAIDPAQFTHHSARWGIHVPVLAVQVVLGERAWVQCVPALLFGLVLAWAVFELGKLLGSVRIGVLAVVLTTVLPAMSYVGSQLLPTVFESAYCAAALLLLLKARSGAYYRWVLASCACFCAAYLAYETSFFFLPGLVVTLWLLRRRWTDVALYLAGIVACIGIETLAYRLLLGFRWGRVTIISRHHLDNPKLRAPVQSLGELFERYLELSRGFRELFYAALLVSLLAVGVALWRRRRLSLELYALLAMCWGFFFANTFAFKSLSPLRLAQPLNERYLFAGAPFLALIVAWAVSVLWQRCAATLPQRWFNLRSLALALGLLVLSLVPARWQGWSQHALARTHRYEKLLQTAFESGTPIASRDAKANALVAVRHVFLTQPQATHAKLGEPKIRGKLTRVLVDTRQAKYRGLNKKKRGVRAKHWPNGPHVEVSALTDGFTARKVD